MDGEGKSAVEKAFDKNISKPEEDNNYYVVKYVKNINDDKAESAYNEILEDERFNEKDINVLIVDSDAYDSSDKKELAYRIAILTVIYGDKAKINYDDAVADLGFSTDEADKIFYNVYKY